MSTETKLSDETIEKLKKLLGGFSPFGSSPDIYFICISKMLKTKVSAN